MLEPVGLTKISATFRLSIALGKRDGDWFVLAQLLARISAEF
jgi:hypothetical protein